MQHQNYNNLIKKSYNLITRTFLGTALLIPVYLILGLIFPTLNHYVPLLFLYIVPWLVIAFSQYNNFILFNSIYREWKKTDDIEKKKVLECIMFKNIYNLKKFKQDRKKNIKSGNVKDGFTIIENGSLGCVFYSQEKINTYTYIIIIETHHIITIPLMFDDSIYPKFSKVDRKYVKNLFLNWADENGYKVERLLYYDDGIIYDPESQFKKY